MGAASFKVDSKFSGKGAIKEVELGDTMDILDTSETNSGDDALCPDAHGQALVHFSKTSTMVSDTCDLEKCSAVRMHPDAENFEIEDLYQIPGLLSFEGLGDEKPTSYCIRDQDYTGKMTELQAYLDTVKNIVRPGCSQEVLTVALGLVSELVNVLSCMTSTPRLHASL